MIWTNPETNGVSGASHDSVAASTGQRVFARVALLIARAGLKVEGAGAFAIGLTSEGSIDIAGDVLNRQAILAALEGDAELVELLAAAISAEDAPEE